MTKPSSKTPSLAQQTTGDIDAAVETEKTAIALLPEGPSALRAALEPSLAKYLIEQKSYAKAEPLLLGLHKQLSDNPQSLPKAKHESVQRIIDLYTAWHAAEPDKSYVKKTAEWRAKLTLLKAQPSPDDGK